ncbi:MAG TPA: TonB family protein, partial [Terriglobales bacterium]|nr:TonB family protein [Terriglobales bacterium]
MLEQLERHETRQQVALPRLEIAPPVPVVENDQRQRRRMVVALVLLLVALSLVLVKDRAFWLPTPDVADNEAVDDDTPALAEAVPPAKSVAPAIPSPVLKRRAVVPASPKAAAPSESTPPMVSASRAVLPPLRVEVVAGDRHQLVKPGSPSVAVDLQSSGAASGDLSSAESARAGAVVPARDQVQMSTDTRQALTHPVRPEYPLLARQMKVQGAVLLNALIGRDGDIQTLQVLSGPAILADAAREAVKQWRFKPYVQDGQPVETQAKITVNFEIRAH